MTIGDKRDMASLLRLISRMTHFSAFSGEELRRLPMESVDSVAEEPVSSTLKLALSAISAKNKTKNELIGGHDSSSVSSLLREN